MEELSDAINWWEKRFGGKLDLTPQWWKKNWYESLEFVWRLGNKSEFISTSTVLNAYSQSKIVSA